MNGFVLAGGQSSRMGSDKALLETDGRPLAALAVEKLRSAGLDAKICGARPEAAQELARFAEVVPDHYPRCGPLAGIEAGLSGLSAGHDTTGLFLGVDMPLVPVEFLRWLVERAETSGALATIPATGGMAQPLCAVYSRRVLEGLRTAIAAGNLKMMAAIEEAASGLGERVDLFQMESVAAAISPSAWPVAPPLREWFANANTPGEWARVRELAHSFRGTSVLPGA